MGETAPEATSRIRTATSQSLQYDGAAPSNTATLPSRRTKPGAGAVIDTVSSEENGNPPTKSSLEAIATRPRPLAANPLRNWALSLGLRTVLETVMGGLPAAVVTESPVAAVGLVLVTCSWGP